MQFDNGGQLYERLSRLFNILIAIPLVIVSFGYLEIYSGSFDGLYRVDSSIMTVGVILVLVILAGIFMRNYQQSVKRIPKDLPLPDRVRIYYEGSVTYYVRMFVLSMTAALFLVVFGNVAYAGAYAFLLFTLSINRPGIATIANHLGLEGKKRSEFINNEPLRSI